MKFLLLNNREAFYGGAAGGGKSDALLMAALMYVDTPGYNAILFRKTLADLQLPEALIIRSIDWLGETEAHWHGQRHVWTFPSGATLSFGYLQHRKDKYRYQSAAFQFIGWDELTQFEEDDYRYLLSRLRRLKGVTLPLRVRSASNPGNIGHEWVKQRFITEGREKGRTFIPAKLQDNPYLDQEEYIQSLMQLDPITRKQLLEGDWTARREGGMFKREWFKYVDGPPPDCRLCRYWDLAATEEKPGTKAAYTAGGLVGESNGIWYIIDIIRRRDTPANVEKIVKSTAYLDAQKYGENKVQIYMEQEPGSAGKNTISHYSRNILMGYPFRGDRVTGSKTERAAPVSSAAEQGNIAIIRGAWVTDFIDEAEAFPQSAYKDQIDCISGAFSKLAAVGGELEATSVWRPRKPRRRR